MNWKVLIPILAAVFAVGVAGLVVGDLTEADINDPEVKNAFNFAVVQYNKDSHGMYLTKVAKVIQVQQQLVSGMKYFFTVEMAKTPCKKDGTEQHCNIYKDPSLAQPYQCMFTVWSRPWLNDMQLVGNRCLRNAAPILAADELVGGLTEADINDPEVKSALNFAVVQYNKDSNGMYLTKVAKVIQVQQQVVAGMKYFFTVEMAKTPCKKDGTEQHCNIYKDPSLAQPYQCMFTVWSRPWLNDMQLVGNRCLRNAAPILAADELVGGLTEADINDPEVKSALNFAVVQYNKDSNGMYLTKVAKVIQVQQQLVSGMKYFFTVEMAKTPCKKDGTEQHCNIYKDPSLAQPYQCMFTVWSRPWLNDMQLVGNRCLRNAAPILAADELVGGLTEADINDPEVKSALNFAVVQYNKDSNGMYLTKVAKVIQVQQQLVSGMKYFFTVEMAKTPCKKDGTEQHCNIYKDPSLAQPYQCMFTVWSRPWLNDMQLVGNRCLRNAAPILAADELVGGLTEADINDPEVKSALNFAVVQYNKDSNGMYLTKVAKVIQVQQQVVSGMKYFFTVEMAKTPCKKDGTEQHCNIYKDPSLAQPYQCTFTVWSRPWLNDMQLVRNRCLRNTA